MSVQKGGLNLPYGDYTMTFPLVNFITFAQRPLPGSTSKAHPLLDLTPLAFPTNTSVGATFQTYIRGDEDEGSVQYVVKWRGLASYSHISFGTVTPAARTRNGVTWNAVGQNSLSLDGRMTFTLSGATAFISSVTIKGDNTASGADQFTELVICRADEEDYYDDQRFAGVKPALIFSPYYITELTSGGWSNLRFMEPQQTNISHIGNWADRPSVDQFTLHSQKLTNLVNDGTTQGQLANSGDAYSGVYGSSGSYGHGEVFCGVAMASNTTTSPTLNIDGRGAKPILMVMGNPYVVPVATGTNIETRIVSGTIYSFSFDVNFDAWLARPTGLQAGYPMEHMIAQCNATGIPGWFCLPVCASDDYITQFGNLLASSYTPSIVYVEYANEIWNLERGFEITGRVEKAGLMHFTSPQITTNSNAAASAYCGLRFNRIAEILRPILGSKLKMVLAGQGSNGDSSSTLATAFENLRMQNANYAEISDANAPWRSADLLSYALYCRPTSVLGDAGDVGWSSITQAATLKTHVDNFDADNSRTDGFDWLKSAYLADAAITVFMNTGGRFANWNTLAASYDSQISMYEINHQIDAPSSTFTAANAPWSDSAYGDVFSGNTRVSYGKINNFLTAFFASPQYEDVWTAILTSYYGYQRSLSTALFPLCGGIPFPTHAKLSPGAPNAGVITATPYGQYTAFKAWNNRTTRVFTLKN